tara:strand:+ start:262 stop:1281 length:1020 start_codon:yes stop_codon:yes gene_type:complete
LVIYQFPSLINLEAVGLVPKKWYTRHVESSKVGVIDCISAGFSAVYRKPAILVVPIIVDLLLWFTPGISPQPLIDTLASSGDSQEVQIASSGSELETSAEGLSEELFTVEDLEALGTANLAGILGTQVQSYLAFPSSGRSDQANINVETWQGLVLALLLFMLGSVVIGTIYLEMLAQQIKTGAPWPIREGHLARLASRLLGYIAIVTGIYGLIAAVCVALLVLLPQLVSVIIFLGVSAAFMALVYLLVGESALFLEDLQPIQALKRSIAFARSHVLQLAGLAILSAVLALGLQIVLGKVAAHSLGLPPAIFLNASVMTALTFAVMTYYWNHTQGESTQQ